MRCNLLPRCALTPVVYLRCMSQHPFPFSFIFCLKSAPASKAKAPSSLCNAFVLRQTGDVAEASRQQHLQLHSVQWICDQSLCFLLEPQA